MNRTNIEHALYALAMQAAVGLLSGNWWAGAALAVGFFVGREHAQYQRKLGAITTRTDFRALQFWKWGRDGVLDLGLPIVATMAMAMLASADLEIVSRVL